MVTRGHGGAIGCVVPPAIWAVGGSLVTECRGSHGINGYVGAVSATGHVGRHHSWGAIGPRGAVGATGATVPRALQCRGSRCAMSRMVLWGGMVPRAT